MKYGQYGVHNYQRNPIFNLQSPYKVKTELDISNAFSEYQAYTY